MRSVTWPTTLLLGDCMTGVEGVIPLGSRFDGILRGVVGKTLPAQPFCVCGVVGFEELPPTCFLNADVDGASLIGVPTVE
jgi:hypothetical protein